MRVDSDLDSFCGLELIANGRTHFAAELQIIAQRLRQIVDGIGGCIFMDTEGRAQCFVSLFDNFRAVITGYIQAVLEQRERFVEGFNIILNNYFICRIETPEPLMLL